jgi:hypothetical protein
MPPSGGFGQAWYLCGTGQRADGRHSRVLGRRDEIPDEIGRSYPAIGL